MLRFLMRQTAFEKLLPTLNHMKMRPSAWFLEGGYLEGFYAFLLGYSIAAKDQANIDAFSLGLEFSQWLVREKGLCGEASLAWGEIIRLNEAADTDAFERALALVCEFKNWPQVDGDLTKF